MPPWLREALPDWAHSALLWAVRPHVLAVLSALSFAFFVFSLAGVPWFARRIPTDYLITDQPRPLVHGWPVLGRIGRNLLGALLLLMGVLMLALPGQGILTIVVALTLLDFPGKHRLQRRILRQPNVLNTINRLRKRSGRPPLRTSPDSSPQA